MEAVLPIVNTTLMPVHAATKSVGATGSFLWIKKYIEDITREEFSKSYAKQIANIISDGTENDGYSFQVSRVSIKPTTESVPMEIIK